MKKIRQSLRFQFLLIYLLVILAVIGLFNLFIYKNNEAIYSSQQANQATTILEVLAVKLELPLIVADVDAINKAIDELKNISELFYVKVNNNDGDKIAERYFLNNIEDGVTQTVNNSYVKKLFNNEAEPTLEDIFENDTNEQDSSLLATLELQMKPYHLFASENNKKLNYIPNIILLAVLISFGLLIFYWNSLNTSSINNIKNMLSGSILQQKKPFKYLEIQQLYSTALNLTESIQQKNSQLDNLKQEIRYAREDGHMELHGFIKYLEKNSKKEQDPDLDVFFRSVLSRSTEGKKLVNISKLIKTITAQHSDLADKNNTLVIEYYLDNAIESNVLIDENMFNEFFGLFLSQIIPICKNSQVKISVDITPIQHKSKMLRIAIESDAPSFKKSLEMQSLFDFDSNQEVSLTSNNTKLIASKHLLQKSGGDYFISHDEIRFEYPVTVQKSLAVNKSLNLVNPLDKQLNVLVYDSDPIDRMVLMGYLEKFGQQVDKATTKQVVLQKFRRNEYQLICVNSEFFSDQDPYFLKNFQSEFSNKTQVPLIIVISTNGFVTENDFFKDFNARLLAKPLSLNELAELIESVEV